MRVNIFWRVPWRRTGGENRFSVYPGGPLFTLLLILSISVILVFYLSVLPVPKLLRLSRFYFILGKDDLLLSSLCV